MKWKVYFYLTPDQKEGGLSEEEDVVQRARAMVQSMSSVEEGPGHSYLYYKQRLEYERAMAAQRALEPADEAEIEFSLAASLPQPASPRREAVSAPRWDDGLGRAAQRFSETSRRYRRGGTMGCPSSRSGGMMARPFLPD